MREIEFRGKDIVGNWHYGFPTIFSETFATITKPFENAKSIEIETLGQYTGLKDKKGTKIFEGDIMKQVSITGRVFIGYIRYYANAKPILEDKRKHCIDIAECHQEEIEVIGNIYDSPELLNGGANESKD